MFKTTRCYAIARDRHGKPTRQARVYYVAGYDDKKTSHTERLTKSFLESWDHLSAWDHEPVNEHGFVYGVFIIIEGHLLSLLSEKK